MRLSGEVAAQRLRRAGQPALYAHKVKIVGGGLVDQHKAVGVGGVGGVGVLLVRAAATMAVPSFGVSGYLGSGTGQAGFELFGRWRLGSRRRTRTPATPPPTTSAVVAGSGAGVGEGGVVRVEVLWRLVVAAEHRLRAGLHDLRARVGGARELQASAVGLVRLSRFGVISWRTGPGARVSSRRGEVECTPVPS